MCVCRLEGCNWALSTDCRAASTTITLWSSGLERAANCARCVRMTVCEAAPGPAACSHEVVAAHQGVLLAATTPLGTWSARVRGRSQRDTPARTRLRSAPMSAWHRCQSVRQRHRAPACLSAAQGCARATRTKRTAARGVTSRSAILVMPHTVVACCILLAEHVNHVLAPPCLSGMALCLTATARHRA